MSAGFDYIIVGAGSAGSVLANRLSANPEAKVLLLEAGEKDSSILIKMPSGVGQLLSHKSLNWCFETEGQPHMNNRRLFWPRGKTLGGSSSINGMIYIRGHARDYDLWRQMGCEGWSYADTLPYFRKSENYDAGADEYHGGDGPLRVQDPEWTSPTYQAFIDAGKQAGHAYTSDFNGAQQEGVGPYQHTIHNGERWSAARGYLRPIMDRQNLTIETGALTHRVLFEGSKAVGVEYGQRGEVFKAYASSEVILCGGAVNSPQTLLLSGIGDGDYLTKWGLNVVSDLKGVGQNLQDHLDYMVQFENKQPISAMKYAKFPANILTGMNYVFFNKGAGRSNHLESGGFLRTDPGLEIPDIQLHFVNALMEDHARGKVDVHGFSVHVCQLRPESKGFIALKSLDPSAHPLIQPNYLAEEKDRIVMREGVRMTREICYQNAFDPYRGKEIYPGTDCQSDDEIDAAIRTRGETIYHPVGTCKMGVDAQAVVDTHCRVHGVENLRVVDASVMPTLIGGNTNAPTIMIAEKISDHILGKPFLEPVEAPVITGEQIKHREAAA